MKFVIDMNLSKRWCQVLQDAGHQAVHWSDVGAPNAPDVEIMALARGEAACVMTNDLDFSAILGATNADGPSVLQLRARRLEPDILSATVLDAINRKQADLDKGCILTIDMKQERLRVLPLNPGGRNKN